MSKSIKEELRIASPTASRARAKWSEGNTRVEETEDSSFRVPYYGATEVSVPFTWESQPGTPKHHLFSKNDKFTPSLTPPPSYSPAPSKILTRKSRFFSFFLSSFSRNKNLHVNAMSSSTSNSGQLSWSASSSSSSPVSSPHRPSAAKSQSLVFDEDKMGSSNRQVMCFGYNKEQGCYSLLNLKNSIVSTKER